jgi:polysaccharide biosynthesis protein PslG
MRSFSLLAILAIAACSADPTTVNDAGALVTQGRDAAIDAAFATDAASSDDANSADAIAAQPDSATLDAGSAAKRIVMADYLGFNLPLLSVVQTAPAVMVNEAHYQSSVSQLKALGLKNVRIDFHWAVLEPTQGQTSAPAIAVTTDLMNRLHDDGISVLVQFGGVPAYYAAPGCDPTNALGTDTCPPSDAGIVALAERMVAYAQMWPSIEHWQIGNEPNLSRYAETKFDGVYARAAQAVVDAFAAAGIEHKLVLAGMGYYGGYTPAPSPEYVTKAGSMLLDVVDNYPTLVSSLEAVAYHPYTDTPEGEPNGVNPMTNGVFLERAAKLHADLHAGGNVKQIWATEFGWSTYQALTGVLIQTPITLEQQGDYFLRRLALMFSLDYSRAYMFNLADMGPGPETLQYMPVTGTARDDFYGVLKNDGTPKPAYAALAKFLEVTGAVLTEAAAFTTAEGEDSSTYGPLWTREDGKHIWMARAETATTASIPSVATATIHDCVAGTQTAATVVNGAAQVPLSERLAVVVY